MELNDSQRPAKGENAIKTTVLALVLLLLGTTAAAVGPDRLIGICLEKLVEDLNLTPEQVKQLHPIIKEHFGRLYELTSDSTDDLIARRQRELSVQQGTIKRLVEILDKRQQDQLGRLGLLIQPELRVLELNEALELSVDQFVYIVQVLASHRDEFLLIDRDRKTDHGRRNEQMRKLLEEIDNEILDSLTVAQKETFAEMKKRQHERRRRPPKSEDQLE